jgi:hypothetical protein
MGNHSFGAGWRSSVAQEAHNLRVAGSNPAPATMKTIYALLDPDTRRIRYVGATGDPVQRLRVHWSSRLTKRKSPLVQWIKTLNVKPKLHVLQRVSDDVAHDAEEYWIKLLRQVPTVDLLNTTDVWSGGRNLPLAVHLSDAQREKIRLSTASTRQLAKEYDVSASSINRIKRGIR